MQMRPLITSLFNVLVIVDQFTNIVINIYSKIGQKLIIARLKIEIYIVESFRANLLIGNNIMVPNNIILYPDKGQITIGAYKDIIVNIVT